VRRKREEREREYPYLGQAGNYGKIDRKINFFQRSDVIEI
jgi:hypothetical protein